MLQSMGHRVRHDLVMEQQQQLYFLVSETCLFSLPSINALCPSQNLLS